MSLVCCKGIITVLFRSGKAKPQRSWCRMKTFIRGVSTEGLPCFSVTAYLILKQLLHGAKEEMTSVKGVFTLNLQQERFYCMCSESSPDCWQSLLHPSGCSPIKSTCAIPLGIQYGYMSPVRWKNFHLYLSHNELAVMFSSF